MDSLPDSDQHAADVAAAIAYASEMAAAGAWRPGRAAVKQTHGLHTVAHTITKHRGELHAHL